MSNLALPTFNHPAWCDARYCDSGGGNPRHCRPLHRWQACDVAITVSVIADDEWVRAEQRVIKHPVAARLNLEDLGSLRAVAGHEVVITADVELDAAQCRRLAEQLLETAGHLEAEGGAR